MSIQGEESAITAHTIFIFNCLSHGLQRAAALPSPRSPVSIFFMAHTFSACNQNKNKKTSPFNVTSSRNLPATSIALRGHKACRSNRLHRSVLSCNLFGTGRLSQSDKKQYRHQEKTLCAMNCLAWRSSFMGLQPRVHAAPCIVSGNVVCRKRSLPRNFKETIHGNCKETGC